jgi:hypothetical protein
MKISWITFVNTMLLVATSLYLINANMSSCTTYSVTMQRSGYLLTFSKCVPTFSGGYSGAIIKLRGEYESSTRQERVKQVLDCITFDEFVEGTGTYPELKTALDRLKTRIVKLT